jgi:hypothetical protein
LITHLAFRSARAKTARKNRTIDWLPRERLGLAGLVDSRALCFDGYSDDPPKMPPGFTVDIDADGPRQVYDAAVSHQNETLSDSRIDGNRGSRMRRRTE